MNKRWYALIITAFCLAVLGLYINYKISLSRPQGSITLSLPFSPEDEPTGMMPAGEQVMHNFYLGHPGVDFNWRHEAFIIASANATVRKIESRNNQWDIETVSGDYAIRYTELGDYNRDLREGTQIKKGDLIGTTNCGKVDEGLNCMVHFEFASRLSIRYPWLERLCPYTYFDSISKERIDQIWNESDWVEMKTMYPEICSGGYKGRDSIQDALRIDAEKKFKFNKSVIDEYNRLREADYQRRLQLK
ncbi:MAG TPA: hypothetical protein VFF28_08105 [Candidatus Nanoarchaeia archaeon]|nr:hypothetical protein [Candidatus Nanoarchaeia archaeon]